MFILNPAFFSLFLYANCSLDDFFSLGIIRADYRMKRHTMEGKTINQRTVGKAPLLVLGLVLLGLAGCQEDSGASRAAFSEAGEVSAKRLGNAIASFRDTLGQPGQPTATGESSLTPKALRWEAPLAREDGSRLYSGDINGYRIYYRLRHQKEFGVIQLPGSAVTEYPLDTFPPGAYEFSITTIDDKGLESRRSDAVVVDLI